MMQLYKGHPPDDKPGFYWVGLHGMKIERKQKNAPFSLDLDWKINRWPDSMLPTELTWYGPIPEPGFLP
jgi:hypothetical protein